MRKGQALVEILVALGVSVVVIPAVFSGFIAARGGQSQQVLRMRALALAEEAHEAVRQVREAAWSNIATPGIYHPVVSGTSWVLVPEPEIIDGFTRQITINDFLRDGVIDPSTKEIVVQVSWPALFTAQVTSTTYLTRFLDNETWVETTVADFSDGTFDNTVVTNVAGGEVQLGGGGASDWCVPNLSIPALDLPKQGEAVTVSAVEGRVFAGTGLNASGVSFANVAVTQDTPPQMTILGTVDGYKTNDVFGQDAAFVYIATDTNQKEVVILDLSTSAEVGSFDAPGPADGEAVFVEDNLAFTTAGNTLYTFDVTTKTGTHPVSGSVTLSGVGKGIFVVGDYAFVVTNAASNQLQIINIANGGQTLTMVGQTTLSGAGRDLFVAQTANRAYVVTQSSPTNPEFFIVDTTTKFGNQPVLSSFDTKGMDPRGVAVVPANRAIIVGVGGQEYQVLDISNETTPTPCGGLNLDNGVNGLATVLETDGDAFSYIVTGDAGSELKVIEGGPGGAFAYTGTYTSSAFDAGEQVAFYRLIANFTEPANTNLNFQIAANAAIEGLCQGITFNFVGPDGTANTFFEESSPLPFNTQGQCFAYRAYFGSNTFGVTPVLTDVTVSYSP